MATTARRERTAAVQTSRFKDASGLRLPTEVRRAGADVAAVRRDERGRARRRASGRSAGGPHESNRAAPPPDAHPPHCFAGPSRAIHGRAAEHSALPDRQPSGRSARPLPGPRLRRNRHACVEAARDRSDSRTRLGQRYKAPAVNSARRPPPPRPSPYVRVVHEGGRRRTRPDGASPATHRGDARIGCRRACEGGALLRDQDAFQAHEPNRIRGPATASDRAPSTRASRNVSVSRHSRIWQRTLEPSRCSLTSETP